MKSAKEEMTFITIHDQQAKEHKQQISHLMENFPPSSVVAKANFIQNIVHGRSIETSQVILFNLYFQHVVIFFLHYVRAFMANDKHSCLFSLFGFISQIEESKKYFLTISRVTCHTIPCFFRSACITF
jgi:hypothetical protein